MFFSNACFSSQLVFFSSLASCSGVFIILLLLLAAAKGTVEVTALQVTSQECSELQGIN